MQPITLRASGMVTGVGLNAPASCAAIRCGLTNFVETRFMDSGGEWIMGSYVPLDRSWRGRTKLVHLVVPAISECLCYVEKIPVERIPLFLCVAEKQRPGRLEGLDNLLLEEVQTELGIRFHQTSDIIASGRSGGIEAVKQARAVMVRGNLDYCIVAGVDTYLVSGTLSAFEKNDRILTASNSNGFIPGEAGAAVLLSRTDQKPDNNLAILGIGFGEEKSTIESEEPLRADGLVEAIKQALAEAKLSMADIDYRITAVNGEQYWFKEAALALTRILRERIEDFDIWHPADCVGEVGAATVPLALGVVGAAARKGYAPGNRVVCHFSDDYNKRAALVLSAQR